MTNYYQNTSSIGLTSYYYLRILRLNARFWVDCRELPAPHLRAAISHFLVTGSAVSRGLNEVLTKEAEDTR
jgi:hypothetical protein